MIQKPRFQLPHRNEVDEAVQETSLGDSLTFQRCLEELHCRCCYAKIAQVSEFQRLLELQHVGYITYMAQKKTEMISASSVWQGRSLTINSVSLCLYGELSSLVLIDSRMRLLSDLPSQDGK